MLTLVSWNVNGVRAAEKKGFLNFLQSQGADIVGIQETKAHPDQLSESLLKPEGFHTHWNAAVKKGYSGVATFSKVPPRLVRLGFDDERFDHEGRALMSDYGSFVLFNIYFPNGGRGPEWVQHKLNFYEKFLEVAGEYQAKGTPVIVTGDFNTAFQEIDLARPKENAKTSGFLPIEREGLGKFFEFGFVDTFRHLRPEEVKYSWWDMRSRARLLNLGWRIDYFMVTRDILDRVVDADIYPDIEGSDHAPVSLTIDLTPEP